MRRIEVPVNWFIRKAVYGPEEYASLKEFFNRVVKLHNTDLVFGKREEMYSDHRMSMELNA